MNINQSLAIPSFICLLVLAYFALFYGLEIAPLHMWDEATYANNSIDMAFGNSHLFVIEHLEQVDLNNTKPPFVIWLQAICLKFFGINEFAIRLPSAVFGLFTVLLVYFFSVKNLQSKTIGLIAVSILLSAKGYVSYHVVRSGDLDATLVFWLTLGALAYIDLLINKPTKNFKHFLVIALSIFFGFMTKGIAGLFFIPFLFLITSFKRNHSIFKDVNVYAAAAITLCGCIGFYLLRESLAPGYLDKVIGSELLRYNSVVMGWHVHPMDYYFQNMKNRHFEHFYFLIPLTVFIPFITKSSKKWISIYLLIITIGYFFLISYPAVKLEWYDAPLYPLISILLSLGFVESFKLLFQRNNFHIDFSLLSVIPLVIAGIYLFFPFKSMLQNNAFDEDTIYSMEFDGAYLRHLKQTNFDLQNLTVFKTEKHNEHYDQVLFYIRAYNISDQLNIGLKHEANFIHGERVMSSNKHDKKTLVDNYDLDTLNTWKHGYLFEINSIRTQQEF